MRFGRGGDDNAGPGGDRLGHGTAQHPHPDREHVPGAAAWKPWKVAIAFVAVVGLALAGRANVASSGEGPLLAIAIALMLLTVAPVGLALLLANMDATSTARDFGLCRPRLVRAVALMFAVFIGTMAMFVLWSAALGLDEDAGTPLAERLGTEGTLNVLILIVVLTVLGPLAEEFLFRGYIFRALRNWRGLWPAAITTGVLFAATHIGWLPLAAAVPATVFGIAMCCSITGRDRCIPASPCTRSATRSLSGAC